LPIELERASEAVGTRCMVVCSEEEKEKDVLVLMWVE
jgi:hypothetical protein